MKRHGRRRLTGLLAYNAPVVFGFFVARKVAGGLGVPGVLRRFFEVASTRPSTIGQGGNERSLRARIEYAPNRIRMRNVDVSDCIQWAYGNSVLSTIRPQIADAMPEARWLN
jgi:hypothetical protein